MNSNHSIPLASVVFAICILTLAALPCHADLVYSASAGIDGGVFENRITGVVPQEIHYLLANDSTQHREVFVRSDHGQLTVDAWSINRQANPAIAWSSDGRAIFETDDLFFASSDNNPIMTSLNLDLDYLLSRSNCCQSTGSLTRIDLQLTVAGNSFNGTLVRRTDVNGNHFTDIASGLLASLSADQYTGTLTTPNFHVNPNTPLNMRMELNAQSFSARRAYSQAVLGSSLSFAKSGLVFNGLQPGVTVNSEEGWINNNHFNAVPEPGHALLLGPAALAILTCTRRRRNVCRP